LLRINLYFILGIEDNLLQYLGFSKKAVAKPPKIKIGKADAVAPTSHVCSPIIFDI